MSVKMKLTGIITASLVLAFTFGTTVMAAPKTMSDGNVFDAQYYAANNPDVVAAVGSSEAALYHHYLKYGAAEGRLPYGTETVTYKGYNYALYYTDSWFGDVSPQNISDLCSKGLTSIGAGTLVYGYDEDYNSLPETAANVDGWDIYDDGHIIESVCVYDVTAEDNNITVGDMIKNPTHTYALMYYYSGDSEAGIGGTIDPNNATFVMQNVLPSK